MPATHGEEVTDIVGAVERHPATGPRPADTRDGGDEGAGRGRVAPALRFAGPIVAMVLGLKALVFLIGMTAVQLLGGRQLHGLEERFAIWNGWDAPHYLSLATQGYVTTGQQADYIAFFPGYPLAVRAFSEVLPGGVLTASFIVSGVASMTAALLLAWLVRIDTGDSARAGRAAWFLLIFPTAYFLHLPYTESLFLTFVLGSFVAARSGRWGLAGVVGALAALTRINGVLLIPALAVEAFVQYRRTGRVTVSWLWIGFVAAGLLVYLGINASLYGNPFHFQEVQERVWFKHFQAPWTSVSSLWDSVRGAKGETRFAFEQEILFLAGGLVVAIAAFRWTRVSYGVWALLNVLLFASTSWIQSTPRYAITLFPIFLLLAAMRRGWLVGLVSAFSITMMAGFATLFALGHWAF